MEKNWIDVRLETIHVEDLTGTVNDVITYLSKLTQVNKGFSNYRLETGSAWDEYGSLLLVAQRKETNRELEKRLQITASATKAAATKKVKQEIRDKKTLARLQKKYGKIEE